MRRLLAVLLMVLGLVLVDCGDDEGNSATAPAETQAPKPPAKPPKSPTPTASDKAAKNEKPGPELCLLRAGQSGVERRDTTLWVAVSGTLHVKKFATRAEARDAVHAADLVAAEQAGRYAVFGAAGDDEAVSVAADCLKNG